MQVRVVRETRGMAIQTTDRCLCGLLHIKTGCWVLITIQIVLLVLRLVGLGQGLGHTAHRGYANWSEAVDVVMTLLMLVGAILVVVALLKHRAGLMSFHMVLLIVYIVWTCIALALYFLVGPGFRGEARLVLQTILYAVMVVCFWLYALYVEYSAYVWMGGSSTLPL